MSNFQLLELHVSAYIVRQCHWNGLQHEGIEPSSISSRRGRHLLLPDFKQGDLKNVTDLIVVNKFPFLGNRLEAHYASVVFQIFYFQLFCRVNS